MWRIGGSETKQVWRSEDGFSWERQPDAAWGGRSGHEVVEFNEEIWVLGGYGGSRKNDVWKSADGITWTQMPNAPWRARTAFGSAVYDGKIWVFGGRSDPDYENDVWHTEDGLEWTKVTEHAAWWKRRGFESQVFDGAIWVIGGWDNTNFSNEVWWTTDGANWTQAAETPWSPRYSHATTVHDGRMYVAGGDYNGYRNDVWSSADGETWLQENEDAPWYPQGHLSVTSFNDRIWLLGRRPSTESELLAGSGTYQVDAWYTGEKIANHRPNVLIGRADAQPEVTNALPMEFVIAFSEEVTGFDETDLVFTGSANIDSWSVTSLDTTTYALNVTLVSTDGTVRPALGEGAALSLSGELSLPSTEGDSGVRYDTTPPTVTLSAPASGETSLEELPITVNISESSSPLDAGDVACTNCVVLDLDRSGNTYVALVSPLSEGEFTIQVAADAVTDDAGNGNPASNMISLIFLESIEGEPTSGELMWTEVSPMANLMPVADHRTVVFQGAMWRIGGSETKQVWRSEDGFQWERQPDAPWVGRSGHEVVVFDDEIWVLGGYGGVRRNDVWKTSDGITWTQLPDAAWRPRTAFGSAVYDEKIWVFGGRSDPDYENDVWYTEDGESWTMVTGHAAWWPRRGFESLVFDGAIWVVGGWDNTNFSNELWWTTDGVNWTKATDAPWLPRYSHSTSVHNGRIYVAGGDNNGYRSDVWSSSDGETWRQENVSAPWYPQGHLSITSFEDRIWLIGRKPTSQTISIFGSSSYQIDLWYTGRLIGSEQPTVTINQSESQPDPTNGFPISYTVEFSEPVTGLDLSDIEFDGTATGIVAEITAVDDYTYLLEVVSVSADGVILASVIEGATEDADGNDSMSSTSIDNSITYDSTPPSVTLSCQAGPSTDRAAIPVSVTFSEPVSELATAGFSAVNGSVVNLNGSGANYTLELIPAAEGVVTLTANAGAAIDAAGNASLVSNALSIEYSEGEDPVKTMVTIRRSIDSPGGAYIPGSMLDVVVEFRREGPEVIKPLILNETLPEGWSYVEVVGGPRPNVVNVSHGSSQLSFQWTTADDFSFNLIYRVHVPEDTHGTANISGFAHYGVLGIMYATPIVNTHVPNIAASLQEAIEGEVPDGEDEGGDRPHSMDADGDEAISLDEILRAIQFFNAGGVSCAATPESTEDGYLPGFGESECRHHAGDYAPTDWDITLNELLRLVQFYNLGGCYPCPGSGSEDGYCAGSR